MGRQTEIQITEVTMTSEKPKYSRMAGSLLQVIQAFYQDPENERAYQEWRKERENHQRVAV